MLTKVFNCECGMEFEAACQSELDEKFARHKCPKVNKRVARTQELRNQQERLFVHDTVVNRIEAHNFDKLVMQGMIV